jgi:PAS domain S-box-containing protein
LTTFPPTDETIDSMRNLLKKIVSRYGSLPTTAAVSIVCIAFSASVTLIDVWVFSHELIPAMYLSIGTPALIAPPVTFIMIRLIEHLDAAERRLNEELAERESLNLALMESEQRFRDLAELTSDWFWETDSDHRFTYVSPIVSEVLGRPAQSFIGQRRTEIPEFAEHPKLVARHGATIEAHQPFRNLEYAYVKLNGDTVNVSVSGTPLFDDSGEFAGYRGATMDTTANKRAEAALRQAHDQLEQRVMERTRELTEEVAERRRAEERLRESEERFRGIFEAAPQGIAISAMDGRFQSANDAYCVMTGYDEEELQTMDFQAITHPEDIQPNKDLSEKLLAGEIPFFQLEKRYLHKDGHVIWGHLGVSLVRDKSGQPHYFVAQILDITERKWAEDALRKSQADLELRVEERTRELREEIAERKLAEDALRESEERLQAIMDNSPQSIYLKDINGNYLLVNKNFERRFDIPAGTAHDKTVFDLFPGSVAEAFSRHDREVIETRQAVSLEIEVPSKDNNPQTVLTTKFPIFGTDDEIIAIGAIATDITDMKAAQEALRESEERHRRFAADVAHELRTPLAVMRSNLDSLEEKFDIAGSLRDDVDSMSRLVEQLLAAARLESLDIAETDEADLHQVCTNVVSHIAPIAIKRNRTIEVTGCKRPILIRGNPDALEQALRNLVENALRHSPTRSTVTVEVGDDGSVSVIDKGPGVPPTERDEIFQRFVRSDQNVEGAGLGLSIVRRTVEAHGGQVEIKDTPGGGATFTMRFLPNHLPAAGHGA